MVDLQPVDKVEVLILVDNYVDLLLSGDTRVQRPALASSGLIPSETFMAEHGLSLLVTVFANGTSHQVLLDTGYNGAPMRHNARLLGRDLREIEALVISHGHMDHTGGFRVLLDMVGRIPTVVLHPTAFAQRYLEIPAVPRLTFPTLLHRDDLVRAAGSLVEAMGPTPLADGAVVVTGQVPRMIDFEQGFPGATREQDGATVDDRIEDDQSLVINLRHKGLVVVSGCAHAGIVNSVRYAQELAGESRVHAVIGGFHLTGPAMEPRIDPTVQELRAIGPEVIVPMHCTGAAAIRRFADAFPDEFVLSSVGTSIVLQ